jgi:uncharacterized membrane protein YhdT
MDDEQIYVSKVIPYIKKYIKKHPITGMVEMPQWFQFHYKVKGVRFKNNCYSWNRVLYVNIEVSDKYWRILNPILGISGWGHSQYYMWSSRRRNQYIRDYVKKDVEKSIGLFTIPIRVEIGTIKMVGE